MTQISNMKVIGLMVDFLKIVKLWLLSIEFYGEWLHKVYIRPISAIIKVVKSFEMNSTEVQNPRRKLYDKCLCLPYVFGSVLACAKSAHVFQKLSYSLCRLCLSLKFLTNNSSSDSRPKAFLTSSCALRYYTCGHTFLRHIDLLHSIACTTVLHCWHTFQAF